MAYFKHDFRDFTRLDYTGYAGAMELPNGSKPKIYSVETKDNLGADIILSGDGAGSTIISIESELGSFILSLPGFNMCHTVIADSIVDYFEEYELTSEAIEAIVADYEMEGI